MADAAKEEQLHLTFVLERIREMIDYLNQRAQTASTDDGRDTDEAETAEEVAARVVERLREVHLDGLTRSQSEPYFGRLDFQEEGEARPAALYIGKRGVEDIDDGNRMVIDWRAPVASMFYAFAGQEESSYETQEGEVRGRVSLKRNVVIRNGKLQRAVDSYVSGQDNLNVTDEFLLYRLEEHKDNRLRDIVSSIQAEQDRIIRAVRSQAVVIQGVAGSGKTTVALHRLAYLLYQYADRLNPERMVIFAPNEMFMDYISDVLPELGVGGVQQTTFTAWALKVLNYEVKLQSSEGQLERWFGQKQEQHAQEFELSRVKGSIDLLRRMDHRLKQMEADFIPQNDFEPWPGQVLPVSQIAHWFQKEYVHYPLATRRERVLARIKRWYESEYKRVKEDDKTGAIKKQAASRFRSYRTKWTEVKAVDLYQRLLNEVLPGFSVPSQEVTKGKGKKSNRPQVQAEDLAPLLYLNLKLNGMDARDNFHHVVIDEAQDFSPLQIAVLKEYCPSQSFTILGDLSQSIHTYQGITDWAEFMDLFETEKQAYFQLNVSYRSTMEIIEFANHILQEFSGFTKAEPVFRSGDPVSIHHVEKSNQADSIARVLDTWQETVETVAVVTPSTASAKQLYDDLRHSGVSVKLIDKSDEPYAGGISVVPVYLTKGLEFDAVFITDVNEETYPFTALAAKLLYVGCTRALHRLQIFYSTTPSSLLKNVLQEQIS
ncbi:UvrD-helicase domain-containing protein [Alicyclobacillus sp. SO9]|uniref:HelD family protein n=1 Tax=Alicyclobacillus sp. SO9 TaxID=2665646 RepID=UPI0018E728FB|nr:UvrD-helicase domain-containing protein [Alicyclobacillus sp. SO9]QQE80138.1 AAA family ATPase [Alicyclobacillus sp. SO9]